MSGTILAVVEDLIFLSKIQQTSRQIGVEVELVEITKLAGRLQQSAARAILLDLNHRSGRALDAARAVKSNAQTSSVQIVGFLSHVQGDLAREARQAGLDQVMARSAFAEQLPQLLRQLAGC
ncbi:MAG TPA: response regulator [Terriglobia bacterium]|nr:response regulator [Terriglobia bacterium]